MFAVPLSENKIVLARGHERKKRGIFASKQFVLFRWVLFVGEITDGPA